MKPDPAVEVDTQCYVSTGHASVNSAPLMSISQVVAPATPYEGVYSAVKRLFSEQQVNEDDIPPTPATSATAAATPATPAAATPAACITSVNAVANGVAGVVDGATCVNDTASSVPSGLDATVSAGDGRVKTADVASLPSPMQPLLGDDQVLSRAQRMALFSINQTDGLAVKLESAR